MKLDPEWHKAYIARGDTYYKIKNYSAAIEDYSKAIALDPTNINTYLLRSYVYYLSGQQDLALQDLNDTVRLDPDSTNLLSNRADLKKNIGDFSGAIEDLSKAIQIDPNDYDAYIERGKLYSEIIIDFQEAIADFDTAIRINPEVAVAFYYRGVAYSNLGEYSKALEDINESIRLNPSKNEIIKTRGQIYRRIGDYQSALNDFEKYKISNTDDFEVFFEIGSLIFHKFNDSQKAKEYLLESLKLNPYHFNTNNTLGLINQSERNFDNAISFFSDAIRIKPDYPFTYISRADIYISQRDFKRALEDIDKAMEHEQARPLALKLRANINNKFDEYETAITDLNTAIMLDPDYVDAYIDRGDSWSYVKEYGKAIFDYFQAIMIEFKKGTLIKLKDPDPLKIAKLEEILKIFGENMSKNPKDFSKSFDLADICWNVRNGKYPHRIVENAVHINPNDVNSLHFLSFINVILKKIDYSIDLITRCIELEPNNPSFFIDRANYYEKKGDFTLAAKDYEEAARLDPKKYQSKYLEFLENQKDIKSDIQDFCS